MHWDVLARSPLHLFPHSNRNLDIVLHTNSYNLHPKSYTQSIFRCVQKSKRRRFEIPNSHDPFHFHHDSSCFGALCVELSGRDRPCSVCPSDRSLAATSLAPGCRGHLRRRRTSRMLSSNCRFVYQRASCNRELIPVLSKMRRT